MFQNFLMVLGLLESSIKDRYIQFASPSIEPLTYQTMKVFQFGTDKPLQSLDFLLSFECEFFSKHKSKSTFYVSAFLTW